MALEPPVVRYFLACREIEIDPETGDVSLRRLIHVVKPLPRERFPLLQDQMVLFGLLSSGRGSHAMTVELTRFDQGEETTLAFPPARSVDLGQDPVAVVGLPMVLDNVEFESPGEYSFHLICDGLRLAMVDISVREEQ